MKIVLVGASGTIGSEIIKVFEKEKFDIIKVGRKSGDFQVDLTNRKSIQSFFQKIGNFDALVNAAGDVAFAPFEKLTEEQWSLSINSKLMGQVNLVHEALPFINQKGSFTLISGILSEQPIAGGVAATLVNRALEGFVMAVATELPKSLRINIVSPTVLQESEVKYGSFFPGFIPVEGWKVGQAFKKSVMGIQTGQIYKV